MFIEPKNEKANFVIFNVEEGFTPLELERYNMSSTTNSDALIVCNPDGYVNASSLVEIGFAE